MSRLSLLPIVAAYVLDYVVPLLEGAVPDLAGS